MPRQPPMRENGIGDLLADGADRMERGARILENHRHGRAMQAAEVAARNPGDVLPAKPDMACRDPARSVQQPRDRKTGDGFARAALTDQAKHLALAERQCDATHRLDQAMSRREGDVQVFDFEQRSSHVRMRGSRISRMPSPSRLKHNTDSISARPGKATNHHLPVEMKRAPSATMMPHSGVGGFTPRPMKESPAALRIAQPRLSDTCTAIAGSTFGSRKRNTTEIWLSPQARAASTQPRLRRTLTSARAKRM